MIVCKSHEHVARAIDRHPGQFVLSLEKRIIHSPGGATRVIATRRRIDAALASPETIFFDPTDTLDVETLDVDKLAVALGAELDATDDEVDEPVEEPPETDPSPLTPPLDG